MKKLLWVTLLMGMAWANAQTAVMTHEEAVVRGAYAKLAYATEQTAVAELAMESTGLLTPRHFAGVTSEQRMADTQLNVTLSDFVVGNVEQILARPVTELITPAVNEKLYIHEGYHSYIDKGQEHQWLELFPRWVPADGVSPELVNLSLGQFLESQWREKPRWATYVSYSVMVSFQGKTAGPYKALFLFLHDEKGAETVEPEDATVDSIGLARAMQKPLLATALLGERLWAVPLVKNWVSAKQQALNCSPEQGVCCDLGTLRCGPDRVRVEKAQKGGVQ